MKERVKHIILWMFVTHQEGHLLLIGLPSNNHVVSMMMHVANRLKQVFLKQVKVHVQYYRLNAVTPVRLEHAALRSQVKHSTTELPKHRFVLRF